MRITLVYLHVVGKSDPNAPDPSYYTAFTQRFCATYNQHRPAIAHDVLVCCCGGLHDVTVHDQFKGIATRYAFYLGSGWDIGAFQSMANQIDSDWMICLATPAYFWRNDWLKFFVDAFEKYGDGLYGAMGSFEHAPHIRTSCFACKPERFREYPHLINSREKARFFESTDWNFTRWFWDKGLQVKMVTPEGCYDPQDFRKPDNIFRRGDQSATLIRDRHVDLWNLATPEEKQRLADAADGK